MDTEPVSQANKLTGNILRVVLYLMAFAVPLVYLPAATISFELAKWAVIKFFACFFLAAGVIHLVLRRPSSAFSELRREPLAWIAIGFALSGILSASFAHSRPTAIWGTASQDAGLLSQLSLVVIFFAAAMLIRTKQQRITFLMSALASTIPMCILCINQAMQDGAIGSEVDGLTRVWGTIGNPIYLSDYFVLLIPVAAGFAFHFWKRKTIVLPLIVLTGIQLVVLSIARGRGAVLGLLIATGFVGALALIQWIPKPKLWRGLTMMGTAIVLIMFFLPEQISPVSKAGQAVQQAAGSSMQSRLQFWQASLGIADSYEDWDAVGITDSPTQRFLLGWGQENLAAVINPWLPPEAGVAANFIRILSRAHNESWDRFLMQGLIGAVMYHTWIAALIAAALRLLGWLHTRREGCIFAATLGVGQVAAFAWLGLHATWAFWGLTSTFAILVSTLAFAACRPRGTAIRTMPLVLAVLAGLLAHVGANQTAFEISATSFLAAILPAAILRPQPRPASAPALHPALGAGLPALAALCLGWFIVAPSIQAYVLASDADQYDEDSDYASAIENREQAIALRPERISYYQKQATSAIDDGLRRKKPEDRLRRLELAEQMLLEAIRRHPLQSDPYGDLARLYSLRFFLEQDPQRKADWAARMNDRYKQAVTRRPHDRYIWHEWATAAGKTGGNPGQVIAQMQQEPMMEVFWRPVLHADVLLQLGKGLPADQSAQLWSQALGILETASIPDDRPMLIGETSLIRAEVLFGLERYDEAEAVAGTIRPKHVNGFVRVQSLKARILFRSGKTGEAMALAQRILKRTPAQSRDQIQAELEAVLGPIRP